MRHFFWACLAAPLLLAPVRFQQGSNEIILTPSQAPVGPRGTPAVSLPSPTIIQVSPTRAPLPLPPTIPSDTSFPVQVTLPPAVSLTTSSPTLVPSNPVPGSLGGMPPSQAAICVRALSMLNDVAAVSMEQTGRQNLVPLTIAAAIAQVQAAQGTWPNLAPLKAEGVPFFTPNRTELRQALGYVANFCQNPAAAANSPEGVQRPR